MKAAFRDLLVTNIFDAADALHNVLTTKGSIIDISEVDGDLIGDCTATMVKLTEYLDVLRAREVD